MKFYWIICSLVCLGMFFYTRDTLYLFFMIMYVGFADHDQTQQLLKEIKDKLK